jgi:membrane associated rhomboid family serine protease
MLQGGQWSRLFWGTILHDDTKHLYYNMSSLLFKGVQLEPAMGSVGFAFLIAELWIMCSVTYCWLKWGAYMFTGAWNDEAVTSYNTALVGLSGNDAIAPNVVRGCGLGPARSAASCSCSCSRSSCMHMRRV